MANNPVLSILNPQVRAPTAVPQVGLPADLPDGTTTSLDLPASLQGLLGDTSPQVTINEQAIAQPQSNTLQQVGMVAANSGAPALDFRLQPTYAEGGMVGANGMPVRPAGAGGAQQRMSPQMMEMQLQEFMRKNPQQVQQIANAIMAGFQSGELTPEELNQAGQMAMTALQNPEMYPYIRKYAIQQGIAGEQDLSPEYDQGLIFVLLLAIRSVQQMTGGMGAIGGMGTQTGMPPQPMMSMADGGYVEMGDHAAQGGAVRGPGTGTSDSVPIRVSTGEYVIPAKVVKAKGKEFFDNLLKKYQ